MTDQFVPNSGDTSTTFSDQGTAGEETPTVDTNSVEHQLSVMQKRLEDKDNFIEQLKGENQTTREEVAAMEERMKNMESIAEALRKPQDTSNQDTNLDESEIVGKVIESLNAKQAQETHEQNFATVQQTLLEKYGQEHVEAKVQEAAKANGVSYDYMVQTAKQSPTAFYKLLGEQTAPSTPAPTHGTVTAPNTAGEVRDKAFFAKMHRENPKEFYKPEVQREFRLLFTGNKN